MWWSWLPARSTTRLPWSFARTRSKKGSAWSKAYSTVEKKVEDVAQQDEFVDVIEMGSGRASPNSRASAGSPVRAPKCMSETASAGIA